MENKDILFDFFFCLFWKGLVGRVVARVGFWSKNHMLENSHAWYPNFSLLYVRNKINVNSRSLVLLLRQIAHIYKWFVRQLYNPPSN